MLIQIEESTQSTPGFALFNLAFRPFFLGGTTLAVLLIGFWIIYWNQPFQWQAYGNPIWWHAHELIFGFGAAIIVGFLLTAVQTWTGVKGISGWPLLVLFSLWLVARITLILPFSVHEYLALVIDSAFLITAAFYMARPVFQVKQARNAMFAPILLVFALLNAASHYGLIAENPKLSMKVFHAAIMIIILFVTIVGGRVIPFFTANASAYQRRENLKWIEVLSIASVLSMLLLALYGFSTIPGIILFAVSIIGAASHSIRLSRWGGNKCLQTPLLWSLHLAYTFIPFGFLLMALWALDLIPALSIALHSLTVGAMAGMILAMISRVSLGHTGRPLKPNKLMILAYCAITLAAVIRTIGMIIFPEFNAYIIIVAGSFWVLAFAIFIVIYFPVLIKPRVDGRVG